MKKCTKCGEEKSLDCFGVARSTKDGRNYYCKECKSAAAKAFRAANAEKIARKQREARQANPEAFLASERKYREANRDKRRASARDYSARTKGQRDEYLAEYRLRNKERRKEYNAVYYSEKKADYRARDAARDTAEAASTPPWLTLIHKAQIQEMYDVARAKAKQTGVAHHVDHIHPIKGKGFSGLHVPWNLQVISAAENYAKGNRLPINDSHLMWEAA